MKKILLFSAALALIAGNAAAADLPSIKSSPVAAHEPLWTGFYAGLNAGGTWANNNSVNVTSWPIGTPITAGLWTTAALWTGGVPTGTAGGFIGGGQVGYDTQVDYGSKSLVLGIETDIQGVAENSNNTGLSSVFPYNNGGMLVSSMKANAAVDYLGTVRGRLGYLIMQNLLVYGTGGFAYGGISGSLYSSVLNTANSAFWGGSYSGYSNIQTGWTAGGGAEWMFMQSWSAKVEYLYYDLGNSYSTATASAYLPSRITPCHSQQFYNRYNGNIIRAGVNYHFNFASAPVVAKY